MCQIIRIRSTELLDKECADTHTRIGFSLVPSYIILVIYFAYSCGRDALSSRRYTRYRGGWKFHQILEFKAGKSGNINQYNANRNFAGGQETRRSNAEYQRTKSWNARKGISMKKHFLRFPSRLDLCLFLPAIFVDSRRRLPRFANAGIVNSRKHPVHTWSAFENDSKYAGLISVETKRIDSGSQ